MSLEQLVEEIIQDAMARGEFDNLPGASKPLNHDAYFALSEDERLTCTALKNAGYVPEEVALGKFRSSIFLFYRIVATVSPNGRNQALCDPAS